jgi:hypothetical protein
MESENYECRFADGRVCNGYNLLVGTGFCNNEISKSVCNFYESNIVDEQGNNDPASRLARLRSKINPTDFNQRIRERHAANVVGVLTS